jgi:SRSO17 transposase
MDSKELKAKMIAEAQEIDKYKWDLGVALGHDPLNDKSLNDIYKDWINKNAAAFQIHWEATHKS